MAAGFLTPDARLRVFSDLGVVLPGGKLNAYVAGTPATRLNTYSDSTLLVANTNPVVASAGGLFGPIYLTKGVAYKLVLTDANDVVVWTQDNVSVPADNTLAAGTGISLATVAGVTTITNSIAGAVVSIGANDFRLTLESGVPVSATDQTAKGTLYLTPYKGNRLDLYDAAGLPTTIVSAQVSIAVPATTSQLYDVFAYSNAGVVTLELLAWTNDTTRATAITQATTGAWTKTGDLTRRYLGSFRTTTVAGQTEDSVTKRYVWNCYNRVPRPLQRFETTASWAYNGVVRQANGAAANQVDLVVGVAEAQLSLFLQAAAVATAAGTIMSAGIGEDSTTVYTVAAITSQTVAGVGVQNVSCVLTKVPAVGRHFYAWNEFASASNSFVGASASGGSTITPGLSGSILG